MADTFAELAVGDTAVSLSDIGLRRIRLPLPVAWYDMAACYHCCPAPNCTAGLAEHIGGPSQWDNSFERRRYRAADPLLPYMDSESGRPRLEPAAVEDRKGYTVTVGQSSLNHLGAAWKA